MPPARPLIGIPACRRELPPHHFHVAGEKYITAVAEAAGGVPVLVPALGAELDIDGLLERLDGLLLTGSPSNVEPHRYGGPPSDPGTVHDRHRDATTLPLIEAALGAGLPLFAICRGCQEVNVVFGGSLHQKVHEVAGLMDHREDPAQPLDVQYGPAHEVTFSPGGLLERLTGQRSATVNSAHGQGIERLGHGLVVEASTEDGLIEAFRVADAPAFNLAVQWHPEYKAVHNAFSSVLFGAFGDACRERARERKGA